MRLTVGMLRMIIRERTGGAFTVYYTSSEPLTAFRATPVWFAPTVELARAYDSTVRSEAGDAYTYEVNVSGTLLTREQVMDTCRANGIDYGDLEAELSGGPSNAIELFEDYGAELLLTTCDGFYMSDYDPRNPSRDVLSLLVFNPRINASITGLLSTQP